MCVTFVYVNPSAHGPNDYQLIVINNRDEHYDRPTSQAAWENGILAGRDEKDPAERGGTWMGVDRRGRAAVLLSVLEPHNATNPKAPSRGRLANDFLECEHISAIDYANKLAKRAHLFNGFQLLLIDREVTAEGERRINLVTYMNRHGDNTPLALSSGIYGFGNSPRDKPFCKVQYGVKRFQQTLLHHMGENHSKPKLLADLLDILTDRKSHFPDAQMQSQTEQPPELLQHLSSLYVQYPKSHRYGTRSHSIFLIDGDDRATFVERSMTYVPEQLENAKWDTKSYEFDLRHTSHV